MRTELVTIPSGRWRLHGVLHRPADTFPRKVGVLILQESYNTKFGTHRLFLQLSNALSEAGFYSLRYDNRGICDSDGILDITFADRLADAREVLPYFREHCRLDTVIVWGLCMGTAVAVHLASENRAHGIDGLMLCSILADPADASIPQFGYYRPEISHFLRQNLRQGDWFKRLRQFSDVRKKVARWVAIWKDHYFSQEDFSPQAELRRLREAVEKVGPLLTTYEKPSLLVFGEQDAALASFREKINPGDRLGLGRKIFPPQFEIIPNGGHTFASREETAQLLRLTLNWVEPFRYGQLPRFAKPVSGITDGIPIASAAH
jgi:pimeloyl-ACP methyl ester carboxylesterase